MSNPIPENNRGYNGGKTVLLIVLASAAIIALLFLFRIIELKEDEKIVDDAKTKAESQEDTSLIRYDGKWYRPNQKLSTVLLIGVDNVKSESDEHIVKQADFLLLVVMDTEAKTYKSIHINRDTIADVPQLDMYGREYATKKQQIALAYTQGESDIANCKNTVEAVSNLLYGVDIDHFVCTTMDIVPVANDLVDGVTIYISDDFSAVDETLKQWEYADLRGEHALTYVRARKEMGEPTNLARMERQRIYIFGLHNRAIEKANKDSNFIMESLMKLSPYIISDCSVNQMARIFDIALSQSASNIKTIKGEASVGDEYMEYHVDEDELQKQVIDLFYVEEDIEEKE